MSSPVTLEKRIDLCPKDTRRVSKGLCGKCMHQGWIQEGVSGFILCNHPDAKQLGSDVRAARKEVAARERAVWEAARDKATEDADYVSAEAQRLAAEHYCEDLTRFVYVYGFRQGWHAAEREGCCCHPEHPGRAIRCQACGDVSQHYTALTEGGTSEDDKEFFSLCCYHYRKTVRDGGTVVLGGVTYAAWAVLADQEVAKDEENGDGS